MASLQCLLFCCFRQSSSSWATAAHGPFWTASRTVVGEVVVVAGWEEEAPMVDGCILLLWMLCWWERSLFRTSTGNATQN